MFKYLFTIMYDNHRVIIVNTSVLLIVKPSQHVNIKLEENSTPNKHIKAVLFFFLVIVFPFLHMCFGFKWLWLSADLNTNVIVLCNTWEHKYDLCK